MTRILSGKDAAAEIRHKLKLEVASYGNGFKPGLTIVQVGGRQDSNVYINMKIKAANEIGINASHMKLDRYTYQSSPITKITVTFCSRSVTQSEILQQIEKLNADPKVHGIIVQMPLDCDDDTIDSHLVTNRVDPSKDVDGLTLINEGKVAIGELDTGFQPCTPAGCMDLIERSGVPIQGANAIVIGE